MSVVARLVSVIGYPQTVPADSTDFSFKVDDGEIRAADLGGRLLLTRERSRRTDDLTRLAVCAAGRILKEDAVLYWDGRAEALMLAQEIDAGASAETLRGSFEKFADSCDWWTARAGQEPARSSFFPEMVIRP